MDRLFNQWFIHVIQRTILSFALLLLMGCAANKKMAFKINDTPSGAFDKQGHRGCRGLMPENTIAAMLRAIDLGVSTLEMDVVFTMDKVAIVSHEPFFNHEISTTPAGNYIEENDEKKHSVYGLSYAQTQQYDVGLKPHPRFKNQQKLPATKPSLAALIDSVEAYITAKQLPPVAYNIETKTNAFTDGLFHPAPAEFINRLMAVVKSKGIEQRVIIQSFDRRTLQELHRSYPAIKTALLIEGFDKTGMEEQLAMLGFVPTIYSPAYSLVDEALITACNQKSMKIIPWTVNDRETIQHLIALGVDGIISDYPDLFQAE